MGSRFPREFRFSSWIGTLNAFERRGIAAHRLDVPLSRNLRIALSEGVRLCGGFDEPLYVLGLMPYTLVQRVQAQDTAVTSLRRRSTQCPRGRGVRLETASGRARLREFLVDDLPAATAHNPARVGARLGLATIRRFAGAPVEIDVEGTKVGRYVYAVAYTGVCQCDWIQQDRAIGSPDGPDQETLRLRAVRSFTRDHRLEIDLVYANRGAGRLGTAWTDAPEQQLEPRGARGQSAVERERKGSLLWRWDPRDNLFTEISGG